MLKTVTTELKEHESVASEVHHNKHICLQFETVNQHKNNLNKDLETLGEDIKTLENQLNGNLN